MKNAIALAVSLAVASFLTLPAHAAETIDGPLLLADADHAEHGMSKDKRKGHAEKVRDEHMDHAEKVRDEHMDHAKKRAGEMEDDDEDEAAGKGKHKAKHKAKAKGKEKEKGKDSDDDDDMGRMAGEAKGQGKGHEMSQTMRDRRDERKRIMEEHKPQGEEGEPQKGKKPWWKFWQKDTAQAEPVE